jgi:hypothetical protein
MIMSDAVAAGIVFLIVGWLIPSITLVPIVARARLGGWTPFFIWMIVSLIFSPVLALLALAAVPTVKGHHDEQDDRIPCPFCAEAIKAEANLCPHCRSDLRRATAADRLLGPRS